MKSIVQLICAAVVGVGVGFELAFGGPIWHFLISGGSLGLFLATKFMKHKDEGRDK